jgi:hypothetical protein
VKEWALSSTLCFKEGISDIAEPSFGQFLPRVIIFRLVQWQLGLIWNLWNFWSFQWKCWTLCFWVNQFQLRTISIRIVGIAETHRSFNVWVSADYLWLLVKDFKIQSESVWHCLAKWITHLFPHSEHLEFVDYLRFSKDLHRIRGEAIFISVTWQLRWFLCIGMSVSIWQPLKSIDSDFGHETKCLEWLHFGQVGIIGLLIPIWIILFLYWRIRTTFRGKYFHWRLNLKKKQWNVSVCADRICAKTFHGQMKLSHEEFCGFTACNRTWK